MKQSGSLKDCELTLSSTSKVLHSRDGKQENYFQNLQLNFRNANK